ncbi:hypothetical protein [Mycoplasma wenyonii]|uniref:hypothetical protein n=1 Tax=Mycoplasma wenyonii TaxID=65123 RepID=UPI00130511E1|nr:hypothetical protein [Mycoplasma wenyonii]
MSRVSGSNSTSWSKNFDQIKMNLNDCDKNGRKECSINIGSDVGLKWKDDFQPKVII